MLIYYGIIAKCKDNQKNNTKHKFLKKSDFFLIFF